MKDYDAGLLNDYGGGNVGWWHDYIRSEIARCNEYWREEVDDLQEALNADHEERESND